MAQQQDSRQQQTQTRQQAPREQEPAPRKSVLDDLNMGDAELTAMRNLYPSVGDDHIRNMYLWVQQRGLNPLQRWYHVVTIAGVTVIMPSIDLYRQIAHSSGAYAGCRRLETGPRSNFEVAVLEWSEEDRRKIGVIKTLNAPSFIRMEIKKLVQGQMCIWEVELLLQEAMPIKGNGNRPPSLSSEKWLLQPERMLAKCVEALGLRMAFSDLGGTHTDDEMDGFTPEEKPSPAFHKRLDDAPKQDIVTPPLPSIGAKVEAKPETPAPKPEPKPEPKAETPPAVSKERLKAIVTSSKGIDYRSQEQVASWVSSMSQAELEAVRAWVQANSKEQYGLHIARLLEDDIPF